jgi:hypothetical protein
VRGTSSRAVEDMLWPEVDDLGVYRAVGLDVGLIHRPVPHGDEGVSWMTETDIAPWSIRVLRRAAG